MIREYKYSSRVVIRALSFLFFFAYIRPSLFDSRVCPRGINTYLPDTRRWFLSRVGFSIPFATARTLITRTLALCAAKTNRVCESPGIEAGTSCGQGVRTPT